ncbi:MAG TPA: fibrobacter succinogenes major paralogous domain-containing protein [Bacteroidales bacterium]|nr:fibrobacter succinogenes major paralogous domain-containing protein [Bacteroidales bacterium]HPT10453.1 fibrobacter succinogenes major paralogous domain-containing protein [Bacteroidales bacterium]
MKKFVFFLLFLCLGLASQSQDYLITFAATGDTNVVSSVYVYNLNSYTHVVLQGDDTLHLLEAVGVPSLEINNDRIMVYPNPMIHTSLLVFSVPETGLTTIRVLDRAGKTLILYRDQLQAGTCQFRITGIGKGLCAVHVSGDSYSYCTKLISTGDGNQTPAIALVETEQGVLSNHHKNSASTITMPYHEGDRLLFWGVSYNYSTYVSDVPVADKTIPFTFTACTDADNNHYPTVVIGSQTWMAANLNVGTRIDGAQNQTDNGIIEKYCYLNDEDACLPNGGLYQWNELMQYATEPGVQGLCPTGWHIPTDTEWCTLTQYLDPTVNCTAVGWSGQNAGGKMKSTGTLEAGTGLWHQPNTGATDESAFTGFPSGDRDETGSFAYQGNYGFWWSSTQVNTSNAWSRSPDYSSARIVRGGNQKICGFSVRCVHD